MPHPIIEEKLKSYNAQLPQEEENALKEILQELALYALSRTDFFKEALFQGGTALRILYHLPRFSEDLDFILKQPNKNFQWQVYIDQMMKTFELFDITPEISDRSKADTTVQKLFLKDNSIGKVLTLRFNHHARRKLMIKFEIDTNPPAGSLAENKFLAFPTDYAIQAQDLTSNFAGKCHALLCRQYVKGRDWFDLVWYAARETAINYPFLQAAIEQQGPWAGQSIQVTAEWLQTELIKKARSLNWQQVVTDVEPFVNSLEKESLQVWNADFFTEIIQKATQRQVLLDDMVELHDNIMNEKSDFLKAWKKMELAGAIQAFKVKWFDLCRSSIDKAWSLEYQISHDPKDLTWLAEAQKIDEHTLASEIEKLKHPQL